MQMTADYPGRPNFYDHRAARDPEPGMPPKLPNRPKLAAVVQRTHVEIGRISREFMELAARAENQIREAPGMRMEAKDLAAFLGVAIQRLDMCLRGHPRVSKEYAVSDRWEGEPGKRKHAKAVFYFLG